MSRKKTFIVAGILVTSVALAAWTRVQCARPAALPVLSSLAAFELRDQENAPFTLENLKGAVQVVNFIFTRCPGVCPMLTHRMAALEEQTRRLGAMVHFVSISVDPDYDSPQKMKAYGERHHVDFHRWTFLTGPLDKVESVVQVGFKNMMGRRHLHMEGEPDLIEITHGEHFVLVDRGGRLRAFHTVKTDEDMNDVLAMVSQLVAEK